MTGCPGVYGKTCPRGNPAAPLALAPNLCDPDTVHYPHRSGAGSPRAAALLLAALLPMLTYFGHWPAVSIPIPGTGIAVAIPFAAEEAPGDHHQHCHGESAGCASSPGSVGLAVTLLAAAVAVAIPGGRLIPVPAAPGGLRLQHLPIPDPAPPRPAPVAAHS